ncbi:hypothetical protein V8F20_010951 [Naviculisporaceae sp. PSN 640]
MESSLSLRKNAILCPTLIATIIGTAMGQESAPKQGPAGFMWPPDRVWSAAMDNTAPCGSADGVKSRTEFPLANGAVALIAQDDSYSAQLSISFKESPRTQEDFAFVTNPVPFKEIDPGHSCFYLPEPPSPISPGQVATIQLQYTADFDQPENQTFYACADIVYVLDDDFDIPIPCFNATNSTHNIPAPTATGIPTDLPGHGDDGPPLLPVDDVPSMSDGVSSGSGSRGATLSKGTIAGAVIGSVVGLGLIVGLGLLLYRERQQKKRLERQRDSGRGVKWMDDPDTVTSGASEGSNSVRMGKMSGGAAASPTSAGAPCN